MDIVLKKDACVFTTTVSFSTDSVFPFVSLTEYSTSTFTESMLSRLNKRTSIEVSVPGCTLLSKATGLRFMSKRAFLVSISIIIGISTEAFCECTSIFPT